MALCLDKSELNHESWDSEVFAKKENFVLCLSWVLLRRRIDKVGIKFRAGEKVTNTKVELSKYKQEAYKKIFRQQQNSKRRHEQRKLTAADILLIKVYKELRRSKVTENSANIYSLVQAMMDWLRLNRDRGYSLGSYGLKHLSATICNKVILPITKNGNRGLGALKMARCSSRKWVVD